MGGRAGRIERSGAMDLLEPATGPAEHLLQIELRESSILVAGAGLALLAPPWWSTAAPHIEATES